MNDVDRLDIAYKAVMPSRNAGEESQAGRGKARFFSSMALRLGMTAL